MSNIETIYSNITLKEINQIQKDSYRREHINLLDELNAKYIDIRNNRLLHTKPSQIWENYLEELNSNDDTLGEKEALRTFDLLNRKISGLPINNSFHEIGMNLDKFLNALPDKIYDLLDNFEVNQEELKEPYKKYTKGIGNIKEILKNNLPKVLNKIEPKGSEFIKFNDLPLGTKPFREYLSIKNLKINDLDSSKVVLAIEDILNRENESSKTWIESLNNTLEGKISIAYTLMNWAGYYPDDFDKNKKNRDRFLASTNDMLHATIAARSCYLISNDNAFSKKAIAAYKYAGSKTIICSSKDFIEEQCKLKIPTNN